MKIENIFKKIFFIWAIGFSFFQAITGYFTLTMMLQRTIHLAFAFPLCYYLWAQKKKNKNIFWLVVPIAIISIYTGVYVFSTYAARGLLFGLPLPQHELILGSIFLIIVIVLIWIGSNPIMTCLVILSILYAHFGNYLPGFFGHSGFSWSRIISTLVYGSDGIYGSLVGISSTYLYLIILFGSLLFTCGADKFIIKVTTNLVGHLRGGPAKMAIIASGFFGMISGSALANVAITGSVTIPLMKRTGYKSTFAAAVETVASSGGGFMPPIMGMSAFIMADILSVPYFTICKAAAVPAVIYFTYLFLMVDLRARKINLRGLDNVSRITPILKQGWYYVIPIFVFVYALIVLNLSITRVAFYSFMSTLLLIAVVPKLRLEGIQLILEGFRDGAYKAVRVIIIIVAAQIVISMLSLSALGLKFSSAAVRLSGDSFILLLFIGMFSSIILGMGLPIVVCYIIVAVFVAPALVSVGVWPIAAHLFAMYYANLAAVTPPVASASYVAAGIADSNPISTAIQGVKLAIPGFIVPMIFVYRPALLLHGGLIEVLSVIFLVFSGIVLIAMTVEGYTFFTVGGLHLYERALSGIFGFLCCVPYPSLNIIGLAGGILFILYLFLFKKKLRTST